MFNFSKLSAVILFLTFTFTANAQDQMPFSVKLEPLLIEGFNGIHSYCWAQADDKILLIGGRTDGLHKRQPFASFKSLYNNTEVFVIDPRTGKIWRKSLMSLEPGFADQLQSSNMEFYQDGNLLLLAGGYGYSAEKGKHVTYPYLVVINVKEMIESVIGNKEIKNNILRIHDENMAVTGGKLNKLGEIFYLTGGHRFDGAYNPHGPDHGPGYSQLYTNQIRKFRLANDGDSWKITGYNTVTDTMLLHRRDYNLLPHTDKNGNKMFTMYAGVFQYAKDLPFTTLVDISSDGLKEIPGFNQQFCHYHTAGFPVHDQTTQTEYSLFFGGIAMNFKDSSGRVLGDSNVPFVKHISVVERKDDQFLEYTIPVDMNGYYGASAEFIPAWNTGLFDDGMLEFNKLKNGEQLVGYIPGGIISTGPNVLWSNNPDASKASPVIWKVYLIKK